MAVETPYQRILDRFKLHVPSFRPRTDEEHDRNWREIERWGNALPQNALIGTTTLRPSDPIEGLLFYDTTINQLLVWSGSAWVPVGGPTTLQTSGTTIADKTLSATGTFQDWGSALSITNPALPVSITAIVCGYVADFTTISIHEVKLGISFDAGSSFTFGPSTREVSGQGGNNYNSQNHTAGHFRSGTPSGNIQIKAQVKSTTTTTTATNGLILYTMVPI